MIDPQLQGVKWIKQRFGDQLVVVRLGQRGYLDTIERAITAGDTVLIENIEEELDPVLEPVLGRNTIKRGAFCVTVWVTGQRRWYFCDKPDNDWLIDLRGGPSNRHKVMDIKATGEF